MFHSARLQLTTWYLVIIMAISLGFSAVIYTGLSREVERFANGQRIFIQRRMQEHLFLAPDDVYFLNPDLVNETKHRIIIFLSTINIGILFLAGGLGYILAGRTLQPIADMVDEQNRFISDASHELKTPLTSLKSAFEVHLRNKTRTLAEADEIISDSITEVNKLQKLSESLLELAQFQKPNGNTHMEKLSLDMVIRDAIKNIKPMIEAKSMRIETKLKKTFVHGNRDTLTQLFVILLDNAVKYSTKNQTVLITMQTNEKTITTEVIDHGIGMSKKEIPNIFDRFYRADSARSKSAAGGYGLGLSIAKKIVEAHNGEITVKSDEKNGSTFTIQLPTFS